MIKRAVSVLMAGVVLAMAVPMWGAKKVHTIGDSTMANYDESKTVTRGWCQYLQQFLTGITVNNRGKNGASSKSFYEESAYWASVKRQLQPGDYVLIQFAHNDEKASGVDGTELKEYYEKVGNASAAAGTDYRGTCPSTTYKEYLRRYVNETRAAGCTPILVGAVCRMYFSGNSIKRNGRHDLGDNFSVLTADGLKTGQKVGRDDHSMDYVYQMQEVAKELDVPFIDLTTATAELFLSYGDAACHSIIGDGAGSTHLSATGATLIARRFAGLCKEAGVMAEHVNLTSELSLTPGDGDLGHGYVGQWLSKEFMVSAFDLTPLSGTVRVEAEGGVELSTDGTEWSKELSLSYSGGTINERFQGRLLLEKEGENGGVVKVTAGGKSVSVAVKGEAVELSGGTEVSAYWRLEKDAECVLEGPGAVIEESWHGMELQRYASPNANAVWPSWTGFDATRLTQRNLIEGSQWPAGEIDEVSTRYIEFGLTAMPETTLNVDELSFFVCGCGGNGMCVHVYYSANDDFSDAKLIFSQEKMPANNMQYVSEKPVLKVESGKSVRLRFYPWYNQAASGKTICISDVKIHGYATSAAGIEGVESDAELTGVTYYTVDGRVSDGVDRGVYVVRETYSDGSVKTYKAVK